VAENNLGRQVVAVVVEACVPLKRTPNKVATSPGEECAKERQGGEEGIERHGRKDNVMKWKELLNGDCPRRDAHSPHERCDLVCPDLPTVLVEHLLGEIRVTSVRVRLVDCR
jgi:hypothetical protein